MASEYLGTIDDKGNVTNPLKTIAGDLCPVNPGQKRNAPGGFVVLDGAPADFDVDAAIAALSPKSKVLPMKAKPDETAAKPE